MQKPKVLFTDGEGPIVFKDLAEDLTNKISPGLFPILSLYDDYLAEIERNGYQAGDTLALVAPFFILHGLTYKDIKKEAEDAKLCQGVEEYVSGLRVDGWDVRIISTAYSQLWELVGKHIGVPMEDIACTTLDLDRLHADFGVNANFMDLVHTSEQKIISLAPLAELAAKEVDDGKGVVDVFDDPKYSQLRDTLNKFFWRDLRVEGYEALDEVRVMGGKRKVEAAQEFARDLGVEMRDVVYVGDSITDDAMHRHLSFEGGLPIAINGNGYALRNARVAVATEDMRNLRPVLDAWQKDGFNGVQKLVDNSKISFSPRREGAPAHEEKPGFYYDIVNTQDPEAYAELKKTHKEFRTRVRGAATARLG